MQETYSIDDHLKQWFVGWGNQILAYKRPAASSSKTYADPDRVNSGGRERA